VGQKTGPFLIDDNFAEVNGRKTYRTVYIGLGRRVFVILRLVTIVC